MSRVKYSFHCAYFAHRFSMVHQLVHVVCVCNHSMGIKHSSLCFVVPSPEEASKEKSLATR